MTDKTRPTWEETKRTLAIAAIMLMALGEGKKISKNDAILILEELEKEKQDARPHDNTQ